MSWQPLDTWIVVIGVLAAVSCGLLGSYMVLRRMSMMGDAISHAVLPGLAVAFLISGSRDSVTMFAGAAVVGVLTALLTQLIHRWGKMDLHASMGVVFTTLFAVGLLLIVRVADDVDLDPGCVLYGAIEYAPLYRIDITWPGFDIAFGAIGIESMPRAAIVLGVMTVVNTIFVLAFYKELRITAFDPELATTVGIPAGLMHYLLMVLVAATSVAAFEAVGSILVVAMLIVPGATAHLLTNRLGWFLWLSVIIAAASAVLGHVMAITVPAWIASRFGLAIDDTSTAGSMAVAAGGLFAIAVVFAPKHGLLSRSLRRLALGLSIIREDALGLLFRLEEHRIREPRTVFRRQLREALGLRTGLVELAVFGLKRRGLVTADDDHYTMTDAGRRAARRLVRAHRLWEAYLVKHLNLRPDHVHATAMRLEHVTDDRLRERLAAYVDHPALDPHGTAIPGATSTDEP